MRVDRSKAPYGGGGSMAEERHFAGGEERGYEVGMRDELAMADGVHASVKGDQVASAHEDGYLPVGQPNPSKLDPRDDAGLPGCDRGDWSTGLSFCTYTVRNLVRVGHAPERGTENVTRG